MRVRAVGVVALMAMVVASCGGGAPEAAGPSEGIQVHGDWTIDIYNEDGTLDEHVEFGNALLGSGESLLAGILAKENTPGSWTIRIVADSPNEICVDAQGQPVITCLISDGVPSEPDEYGGLQVTKESSGTVRLLGSLTASLTGEITTVATFLGFTCLPSVAPDDCTSPFAATVGTGFTYKFLVDPNTGADAPVAVTAGQTVQVQVDISFTSG